MKKIVLFLGIIVILIVVARWMTLRFGDQIEGTDKLQSLGQSWKEKAEGITEQLSVQLSEKLSAQNWEIEGKYNIDEDAWFDKDVETLNGDCTYKQLSSGTINGIVLKAAGCKVEMISSKESDFYLEFTNMKKVQAYQKDGIIIVKAMRDTEWSQEAENSVLKLYVPDMHRLNTAEIELGAGNMHIESIDTKELKLKVEAGKLTADQIYAGNLEVDLGAGAVSIDGIEAETADLSVGAGNLQMNGAVGRNLEAECAVGNLQISLKGAEKDYNYELQCVAGNIQIGEEKYSGINEEIHINNSAERNVELDCAMGNILIEFY